MFTLRTNSPEETFFLGKKMGGLLTAGNVVCLTGDLGAGKTLLTQGIAAGLHADCPVTSPTFNIVNVYEADLVIYHFDLYRIDRYDELQDIGYFEYIESDGLCIIEWPDKFPQALPDEYLSIRINVGQHHGERVITITPNGEQYERFCEELKKKCRCLP